VTAADDVRVAEARRRLAAMPPDSEITGMTPGQLITQFGRAHGAAQLLDAYIRDAEADARRLAAIRGLLARFDREHDDRQYALEAIERIVDGGQS
jgi:predicted Zn-dependent protease